MKIYITEKFIKNITVCDSVKYINELKLPKEYPITVLSLKKLFQKWDVIVYDRNLNNVPAIDVGYLIRRIVDKICTAKVRKKIFNQLQLSSEYYHQREYVMKEIRKGLLKRYTKEKAVL